MPPKRIQPEPFGKYLLLEQLGVGGMGQVVLAKAGAPGFERYFALKRILTEGDAKMTSMLISEAKLSISLVHPNIAQVFEFGKVGEHFFLAMEYVEGLALVDLMTAASRGDAILRPADAVFCAIQICRALGYAHDKRDTNGNELGVVHRDVSPHNILVDTSGMAKLIDFGVAKATTNLDKTGAGFIKGKLSYMAPEQAKSEPIDRRSDIYAVGVVLYESLTLKRLFPGDDPLKVLMSVQANELPDLDGVLDGEAPPILITALKRSLVGDPNERYATAGEMERDLAQALSILDPAYTSHNLAQLVREVDVDRDARAARFQSYSQVDAAAALEMGVSEPVTDVLEVDDLDIDIDVEAPRGRAPLFIGVLLALVLAAGGTAYWLRPWERPPAAATRTLLMDSSPMAARVFIDGELKGLTPANLTGISAGVEHAVRIEKEGFAPQERTLEANGPEMVSVRVVLEPVVGKPTVSVTENVPTKPKPKSKPRPKPKPAVAAKGCVSVHVAPWAYVSVGGNRIGQTPQKCIKLPAGKHTIQLTNPALGVDKKVTVTVKPGQTTSIKERL